MLLEAPHRKSSRSRFGKRLQQTVSGFAILSILFPSFQNILITPAYANPQGGQVVGGTATISGQGTSNVTINQSSNRAILNWQDFSVGKGEKTEFIQPDSSSVAFNRVTGGNPSQILGNVTANGQIILANPNGVVFGKGSSVDAAGLVATTHDAADADIMAGGPIRFNKSVNAKPGASVVNEGTLSIRDAGMAALVGPTVRNSGIISANVGKVALGAGNGFTLDFYGDQLVKFKVGDEIAETMMTADGKPIKALVQNDGTIDAAGGQVLLTASAARGIVNQAVNVSGVIKADSVTSSGGQIFLSGGQGAVVVEDGAQISATGATTGGEIKALGQTVTVQEAVIDASGDTGGGKIRLGGGYQGGEGLQRAANTTIGKKAVIKADAKKKGDGGSIVVWSDVYTDYQGSLSAKGGAQSGNGGQAEVSGKESLNFDGMSMLLAANGLSGTLLLDPRNVTVQTAAGVPNLTCTAGVCSPTADSSVITVANLQAALGTGNVILDTGTTGTQNGNITFANNVSWAANMLTVNAAGNIAINGQLTGTGTTTLVLNAGGTVAQTQRIIVPNLSLLGNAAYTLTNAANRATVFAANAGSVNWVNGSNAMTIGTVDGTVGMTTSIVGGNNVINTGTANLTVTGPVNVNGGNLSMISNTVAINNTVAGTGNLVLRPSTATVDVRLNNLTTGYNLTTGEINSLSDGWSKITFGNATAASGNGIYIGASIWKDPIVFLGNIQTTSGLLTGTGNGGFTFTPGHPTLTSRVTTLGNSIVTDGGSVAFDAILAAAGYNINTSGGNITFGGSVTGISTVNAGGGVVDFQSAVNNGPSVSVTGNQILFSSAWGTNVALGTVNLTSNLDMTLPGMTATNLYINGQGTITQSAALSLSKLLMGGGGADYVLTHAGNNVGTIAANTGSVNFKNNNVNTTIGTANGISGITTTDTAANVIDIGTGTLTVGSAVNVANGGLTLTSDDIAITAAITGTGGQLVLQPSSAQSMLINIGSTGYNLTQTEINFLTNGWGGITLGRSSAGGLIDIGGSSWQDPVVFRGTHQTTSGPLSATGDGSFRFTPHHTNPLNRTTSLGGYITTSGGDVIFDSLVNGGGYDILTSNGDIVLNGGGTSFGLLDAGTGAFNVTGAIEGPGDITAIAKSMSINGSWGVASTLGNVSLTSTDGIALDGIRAQNIYLTSNGPVTQNGALTTATLLMLGTGNYTLTNASNQFTTVASNAGNIALNAAGNYGVGTVSGTNGITGLNISLGSTGTVTQSQAITATQLRLFGTGGNFQLTGNNAVGTIAANTGTVNFNNGSTNLAVGTVNGTSGITVANSVRLLTTGRNTLNQTVTANGPGTSITIAGGSFVNTAGSSALNAGPSGRFLVWSGTPVGDDRGNANFDFKQYNATYGVTAVMGAGNGFLYTLAPTVTATLVGPIEKEYDRSTLATLTASNYAVTGSVDGDVVTLATPTSGTYDNRNQGTNKNVSVSGITVASAEDGAIAVYGYGVNSTANANVGTINRKALQIGGSFTADDKDYNRSTAAAISNNTLDISTGIISGDDVNLDAVANFDDSNAGNNKTVTLNGSTLSGVDADNYALTIDGASPMASASIFKKALTVIGSFLAGNKSYDRTTAATITTNALTLSGVEVGDTVDLDALATFDDRNAGTGKAVDLSTSTISGLDANNYSLTIDGTSPVTTADILQKQLTLDGTFTAANKTYNRSTDATITSNGVNLQGGIELGDTVNLDLIAAFDDYNAGTNKTVDLLSSTISGTDASNYLLMLDASTPTALADIGKKSLNVIGSFTADDKTYDRSTAAVIASNSLSLNGIEAGDTVDLDALANFDDYNAGTGKTVNLTSSGISGTDVGNYDLVIDGATPTTTASIAQKALTIIGSFLAGNKTYDRTTSATITTNALNLSGIEAGDTVDLDALATFDDRNAGTGKAVDLSTSTISGADAGNYVLTLDGSTPATTADILQKQLIIGGSFTAADKTYDRTTAATIASNALNLSGGVEAGDNVTLNAVAAFNDYNAGTGKPVDLMGSTISGADIANYTLTLDGSTPTTSATIFKKSLTVNGSFTANDKTYDRSVAAVIASNGLGLSGIEAGDTVDLNAVANFSDYNAGVGKTVNLLSSGISGADVANYDLTLNGSTPVTTATIAQKALTVIGSFTANDKTYNRATAATINTNGLSLSGIEAGDTVGLNAVANFADYNAGIGKTVDVLSSGLTGADLANYSLTLDGSTPTTTATILKKSLTVGGSFAAGDKVYNRATSAVITTNALTLNGVESGDTVNLGAVANFSDYNAGLGKTVDLLSSAISGADISNYDLTLDSATPVSTANITQKSLAINGTFTAADKIYDRATAAVISGNALTLNGVEAGDTVNLNAVANFADYNAAAGKAVNLTSSGIAGADATNYTLVFSGVTPTASATIAKKSITVGGSFAAGNKNYDGNTSATITNDALVLQGIVAGDGADVSLTPVANFASAAIGDNIAVTLAGSDIAGTAADNYQLSLAGAPTTTANIIALPATGITAATREVQQLLKEFDYVDAADARAVPVNAAIFKDVVIVPEVIASDKIKEGENTIACTSVTDIKKADKRSIFLNCGG